VIVTDTTDPTIIISDPPNFFPAGPFILDPDETEIEINWPVGVEDLETRLSINCSVGDPPELISPVGTEYVDGVLTATFSYDLGPGSRSVTCTVMDQSEHHTYSRVARTQTIPATVASVIRHRKKNGNTVGRHRIVWGGTRFSYLRQERSMQPLNASGCVS
jgi:hypothetical protein